MPFKAWEDVDPNHLELPIRGKVYRIPPIGYLDEIRVRAAQHAIQARAAQADETKPDDPPADEPDPAAFMSDEEFFQAVLSPAVLADMRKDNVPGVAITHAAAVAHVAHTQGLAVAEELWNAGFDPEAVAAEMAALRDKINQAMTASPQTSTDTPPSPDTASANPTPSPASTTATTSRKASARKRPAKKSTSTKSSSRRT